MAIQGQAVLVIWNGIDNGAETEFLNWHVHEHIPERVALPGFRRGRRYIALDGHPKYFNFYEADQIGDFASDEYRAALNSPTNWTQRVVRNFCDTSRTVCRVVASSGHGEGAVVETVQLSRVNGNNELVEKLIKEILPAVEAQHGIVGVHLLEGQSGIGRQTTAETKLRNGPDASADLVLLVEMTDIKVLSSLRGSGPLSDEALLTAGAETGIRRGAYALQFSLSKADA